ncbi:MAG: tetratricopeptide repeat protein [Nibricoccus sp.]
MRLLRFAVAFALTACLFADESSPADNAAAIALYREKKNAEARAAFEQLATANPKDAEAVHFLGLIAIREKRFDDAVTLHEKATALAPENSTYFVALGDAYGRKAASASLFSKLSWAKKCHAALEKAVALDPRSLTANTALTEFYRRAPGVAGGGMAKAYAQAESFKKIDLINGTLILAGLYQAEGKFSEIFTLLDEALVTNPDNYLLLFGYGRAAAESGQQLDRGVRSLQRCLELTPPSRAAGHASVWFYLGQIRLKQNDPQAARTAYESALKLDPAHREAAKALERL